MYISWGFAQSSQILRSAVFVAVVKCEMASSSTKVLMQEYHRLAADTLLGAKSNKVALAVLDAAESGQLERLQKLLSEHGSLVDTHHPESGDTPLITAARNGHREVVDLLLRCGADTTLENDNRESFLNVAGVSLQRHILESIDHEDRSMTNAKALLQAAWLGDAVSVKKHLSGSHYLDVDCSNKDGLTPLLLVTKDVSLFSRVESAMQTTYNPEDVLEQLLSHHVNINQTDSYGCSPLHLIASSGPSIHATKMVSLLLKNGASTDSQSSLSLSPLHLASSHGHLTVIVALVEEGGADINIQTTDTGDTPLMLSVRGGHNEAARYLLNKGADVTIVTESGDSALSVARSPRIRRMIRAAWNEQSEGIEEEMTPPDDEEAPLVTQLPGQPDEQSTSHMSDNEDNEQGSVVTSPLSPQQPERPSFFLTDRQISRSLDFEEAKLINDGNEPLHHHHHPLRQSQQLSHVNDESRGSHDMSHDISHDISHDRRRGTTVSEGEGSAVRDKVKRQKFKRRVKSETVLSGPTDRGRQRENVSVLRQSVEDGRPIVQSQDRPAAAQEGNRAGVEGHRAGVEGNRAGVEGLRAGVEGLRAWVEGNRAGVAGRRGREAGRRSVKSKKSLSPQKNLETTGKKMSHDSHMTNRGSHVPRSSVPGKEQLQLYPKTFTFSSSPSPRPHPPSNHHDNKLPTINLTNMKAVAMIAVDTTRGNLRVHGFTDGRGHTGSESPLQRSRSMITASASSRGGSRLEKKRNSTGSILQPHIGTASMTSLAQLHNGTMTPLAPPHTEFSSPPNTKPVLLPRIVEPQLFGRPPPPFLQQSPRHSSNHQSPCPHHHQPTQYESRRPQPDTSASQPQPNASSQPALRPTLSVVSEETESMASSPASPLASLSRSDHSLISRLPSSEDSTLKASSQSDFEADSLDQTTPPQTTPPQSTILQQSIMHPSSICSSMSIQTALPDTLDQFYQLTRQHSTASHTHSSHTVVNYAIQDGSMSLSPIWNQNPSSQSHSNVSTASEYITSCVGTPSTEATDMPVPDSHVAPDGLDSGQGESTDEDKGTSGASSSNETEPVTLDTHCLQWKKGRLLGKGAFGKVWEGLLDSAKLIAVKEIELDITAQRAQSQYSKLRIEVEILRSLHHRNVVRYLGTTIDDCKVYIFMDFISGGSLQSMIKRFGALDDRTSSHYARQIVQALIYLHSNGIVHRDIKGANVMVTSRGVIKLIDFGSAKQSCQEVSGELRSVRGTPYWMAPEVIRGNGYGRKSDVWSLGCTVHEMALTKAPWADYPPETAIFQIGSGNPIPALPGKLSEDITRFILRCVTRDPLARPGADELLDDPFLIKLKKKRKK